MATLARAWEKRTEKVAHLPARVLLGATELYHGLEKLRGEGPAQTEKYFSEIGIKRARFWSRATAVSELAAGLLAMAGVFTRPAALAVLVTQAVAIAKVHARHGFSITRGGYEFNLFLMAVALSLLAAGPGEVSGMAALHRRVPRRTRRWLAAFA